MALDVEQGNIPKFDSKPTGFLADDLDGQTIRGGSDLFDQQTRLSQIANLNVVPETSVDKESYTYKNDPKNIDVEGGTKEAITAEGDVTLLPKDKERKKLRSLAGELNLPETSVVPFRDTAVPLAAPKYGGTGIASAIVKSIDDADYVPDEYEAIEQIPMEFPDAFDILKDKGQEVAKGAAQDVGINYAEKFMDYEVQRKIASTMPYVGGQAVQNLSRGSGLPLTMAEKASFLSTGKLPSDAVVVTQTGILPAPGTPAAGVPVADPGFFERNFGGVDFGKLAGRVASAYSLWQGVKGGIPERDQDKISVGLDAAALYSGNPAVITAAAFWKAATFFGDWFMHGRRGKPKYAKGGADLKSEKGKLMTTAGYGYNNYKLGAGQAGAASAADYVNSYVSYFGLTFNSKKWNQYVAKDSRMGRYDTENMSGFRDPTVLIRKALESKGVITGNPSVNGVPITNQDDYMAKMKEFNKWYKKTAADRGGLVDAKSAGINQPLSRDNVPNKIYEKVQGAPDPNSPRDYHGRPTEYFTSMREIETVENPYDILYYNLVGQFNRGHGGTGY